MSTIIIKNSSNTGNQPGSLQKGELAINVTDGKLFYGDGANVQEFTGATIDTSSFATTGSNTFRGTQTISGSALVSGSVVIAQSVTASSALITSGLTVTGSVNITGSTTQIGNNTLLGNTTLSGSIIISGSAITPTVQVYGNITHDGYIRFNPVSTNIDPSISASYIYVSGSTNDLYFTQNGGGYNNTTRLRWLEGNLYTGLLNGGLITTQSSTVYQVSSGSGIIVNLNASFTDDPYPTIQFINWPNLSASIASLSASYDQQFIAINSSGQIFAQGIPYTDGDFNDKITIGVVVHQNRSTINAVQTFPTVAYGWKQRSNDFIKAFGPLKISGYTLSPSGSSTGSLVLSGGTSFVEGRNYTVDPNNPSYIVEATGITTSKIFRYRQSGSNGWVYDTNAGAGYGAIDPANYSLNGVLTPVSVTNWTIQRVYYFPNSATKALYVYYGNAQYSNKDSAIAGILTETFNEAPNTAANAIFVGYMLLRQNADFTNSTTYEFRQAGLFRGSGAGTGGGGGGGATALTGLTDVNISSPTNGQPLVYDTATTKWINSSSLTASLFGTASYVSGSVFTSTNLALSASYALTSSNALSASYALTASSAQNAQDILIYVKNVSGAQIDKGKVVRISGATGDNALISTASYEDDNNSANTLGITTENIANDSFGYVITEGTLLGINTDVFAVGQLLYLGATGSIIGTAPVAPLHAVRLGQVLRSQLNNGSIYVRIDNGYEIGELHDVVDTTTTSSYGDLLIKSGSVWTNSKILNSSYTFNGNQIISGSLSISGSSVQAPLQVWSGSTSVMYVSGALGTVGFGTTVLGSESNIHLGAKGANEGGQIAFAPGTSYTTSSFIDSYQDQLRILKGPGSGVTSNAEVASWNLSTLQYKLSAYQSATSFTGTPVAALAVNNTGQVLTTAHVTPGIQTYTGNIAWTGTTPPTGSTNHTYNWTRIGNLVTLNISLIYATVGSALTQVTMALPGDCPNPVEQTGLGAANDVLYYGSGQLATAITNTTSAIFRSALRVNSGDTGYELFIVTTTSGGYRVAHITVQYFAV